MIPSVEETEFVKMVDVYRKEEGLVIKILRIVVGAMVCQDIAVLPLGD